MKKITNAARKIKEFTAFLFSSINNAADLVFGGIMQFIWLLVTALFQIPPNIYILVAAILLFFAFLIAVFRNHSRLKKDLDLLTNRLPKYKFSYKCVRVGGKYISKELEKISKESEPISPIEPVTNVNKQFAALIEAAQFLAPKPPTEDEVNEFRQKVVGFNTILKSGLFAVYFYLENCGNLADESVNVDLYINAEDGQFIEKPAIPDEDEIMPKSQNSLYGGLLSPYNFSPTIPKFQIDGELDITSDQQANFWIKNTFQANRILPLPNEDTPLFIVTDKSEITLSYEIISKELPSKQTGTISVNLENLDKVDYLNLDNPFQTK